MAVKAKLVGVKPKLVPGISLDGWYQLDIDMPQTVESILGLFGLKAGALSVMKNGSLTDIEDIVVDKDELQIMLKSLGG